MYKLTRFCEDCNKELQYSCGNSYRLAEKNKAKCRSCATSKYAKRVGDCSFLLENSYESFYWLGFLLADGHFSKKRRLVLCLAPLDEEHVKKLAKKLNCKFKYNKHLQPELSVMHTGIIGQLCDKYSIEQNKTCNPPNLSTITGANLTALSIGFIDGDGCIKYQHKRKDVIIQIKCHSSWLENLQYMFGKSHIEKYSGYAISYIGKIDKLKELKKFVVDNHLPILTRKWDKIIL